MIYTCFHKYIFLFFVFFIPYLSVAQMNSHYKDTNRVMSPRDLINNLKKGALIVRLKTKQPTIKYLHKHGKHDLANKIEKEQLLLNKEIISGFKSGYNFCPVYFITSEQSEGVREKTFNQVQFLNDSLQVDTSIHFNYNFFLTAEFGRIEQDTASYQSQYYLSTNGKDGVERRMSYYSGTNFAFGALIIKSDQFIQLKKPFPYYYRTIESISFLKRSPDKVIFAINKKFKIFYDLPNRAEFNNL